MSQPFPNSFYTPNTYVDKYMALLTPEEYKLLSYIARRIFGFRKANDRISLSQMTNGIKSSTGEHLDFGTGMSLVANREALSGLKRFGFVQVVDENNAANEGTCYTLIYDDGAIDLAGLQHRQAEAMEREQQRTQKARKAREQKRRDTQEGVLSTEPPIVDRTPGGIADNRGGVLSDINTNIQLGNTEEIQNKPIVANATRAIGQSQDTTASKSQPRIPSDHTTLMAAYSQALGYKIPNGAIEGKAAKWLLDNHYSVDQVMACYRANKASDFYRNKHLSLQVVQKNIGAWLQAQEQGNGRVQPTQQQRPTRRAAKEYSSAPVSDWQRDFEERELERLGL